MHYMFDTQMRMPRRGEPAKEQYGAIKSCVHAEIQVLECFSSTLGMVFALGDRFVGCSNYPTCRFTKPLVAKVGVLCPKDRGEIVERRTRQGRIFYGCANYPGCTGARQIGRGTP